MALAEPKSEDEVVDLLQAADEHGHNVRVVGSGHSFTPLCAADGVIISLDGLRGIVDIDPEMRQATVRAGSKLHELGGPLHDAGLAMANMGDIDRQSLAGAVSTGTHGTGAFVG